MLFIFVAYFQSVKVPRSIVIINYLEEDLLDFEYSALLDCLSMSCMDDGCGITLHLVNRAKYHKTAESCIITKN